MTMLQRKDRRNRHIVVDILELLGGSILSAAFAQRSWRIGLLGAAVAAIGLWLDRRNTISEETNG